MEVQRTKSLSPVAVPAALLASLLGWGIWRALASTWTCDDAFISFRYARNLVEGSGLVWNAGERVEGYTNLLWTLALAGAMRLGADPIAAASALGIVCYVVLAGLLGTRTVLVSHRSGRVVLPLAAPLVLTMADVQSWATGGLETMLFTLLVTAGMIDATGATRPMRAVRAGLLLAASVATRPDGVLFAVCGIGALVLLPRAAPRALRLRCALVGALAAAFPVAALVVWKAGYYGELLPTAFFAKSASAPWWDQGLVYLGLFLARNWFLVPLCTFLGWKLVRSTNDGTPGDASRREGLARAAAFAGTSLVFVLYVVRSGGDFMFARRLVPALPLLLCAMEEGLDRLPSLRERAAILVVSLACSLLPWPIYGKGVERIAGVADEPAFYPPRAIALREEQARAVASALSGVPARIVLQGGMCSFGYYSRLPYLVEMTGLTQYSLARLPIHERGLVGHEKTPDDEWLTSNRIHFVLSHDFPPVRPSLPGEWYAVNFGTAARATVWTYEDAVIDPLRNRPGVAFVPIEDILTSARAEVVHAPADVAVRLHALLRRYYFRGAGAKGRALEAEFRSLLAGRGLAPGQGFGAVPTSLRTLR